jgi:pimeloyl-ACP methyl ester carboxylesterase
MPASKARTTADVEIVFHDVLSDDGTALRAWTNDPDGEIDGPTVVLCNGLGTNPWSWPALLRPDCGVRVISWNHRGTGGSARPPDPNRVGIEEFVEDALSVMDHFDVDRAVVMGWSMGVNTMFELAVDHPERVVGLFAVAGVPGDTFSTMLGPLRVPRGVARVCSVNLARVLKYAGRALTPVTTRLPVGPRRSPWSPTAGSCCPSPTRSWPRSRSGSSSRPRSSGTATSRYAPPSTRGSR